MGSLQKAVEAIILDASEKSEASDKAKIAKLLRTIGDKGNDKFDNFSFEADAYSTFINVLDKFDQLCRPLVSVFTARHQFLTMKQNTRSIDEFLTALKKKVRECTFGDLTDDMVLHALTMGLDQERTRRRLFETENLTLNKAIGMCRVAEDTEDKKVTIERRGYCTV